MVKKRIGMIIITLVLLIVSVFLLVFYGNKVKTQTLEYEAVEVSVISAEKVRDKIVGTNTYSSRNEVIVEYEGMEYKLHNVRDEQLAIYEWAREPVTVYLYDGKLYAYEGAVEMNSSAWNLRQAGIWGTYIFGIWHLLCVASLIDKKIKLKKETKQNTGGN